MYNVRYQKIQDDSSAIEQLGQDMMTNQKTITFASEGDSASQDQQMSDS